MARLPIYYAAAATLAILAGAATAQPVEPFDPADPVAKLSLRGGRKLQGGSNTFNTPRVNGLRVDFCYGYGVELRKMHLALVLIAAFTPPPA